MYKKNRMEIIFVYIFFICNIFAQEKDTMSVHYLNVGQSDAIFIQCPTKEHIMLIDAADTRYPRSSAAFKKEVQKLTGGLKKKIDVVIASHNHADHIGNMKWVLENYDVVKYVDNGHNPGTVLYTNLMKVVHSQEKKHELEYQALKDAKDDFTDFCPLTDCNADIIRVTNAYVECKNQNNCSVMIKLTYRTKSFLFVGDAEDELEFEILKDPTAKKDVDADVLKAGHHGSTTSSTLDFIQAVSPDIVVVSCGKRNIGTNVGYKHPQLSSLKSFNDVLATTTFRKNLIEVFDYEHKKWVKKKVKEGIFYTKVDGNVVIQSDGEKAWKKN